MPGNIGSGKIGTVKIGTREHSADPLPKPSPWNQISETAGVVGHCCKQEHYQVTKGDLKSNVH